MGRFTVKIGGEEKVFKDADNLRRYVMRYGNKTKKYTYHGDSLAPLDAYGVMSYTQKDGWKVKSKTGDTFLVDRRSGSIYMGGRYTVRMAGKGESNPHISSTDDFSDALNKAITKYAQNRGRKVYIYDKDKKLGRIGERSGYATWIDHKTKRTTSFKDDDYEVPRKPTGLTPKQPGWIIAGRRAGSKGAFKYYSGESFAAKKYAMVWPYNKYEQAEKTIEELRWYGEYENYEFKIVRES